MNRILIIITLFTFSCGPSGPKFDEDHAFDYLLRQCEFGPRNPSSEGYYKCLDFILEELDKDRKSVV